MRTKRPNPTTRQASRRALRSLALLTAAGAAFGVQAGPAMAHAGLNRAALATLTTSVADPEVTIGETVSDTANLAGTVRGETGSITFRLYGPNDATCMNPPVFTSAAIPTTVDGPYGSGTTTPTAPGTYLWRAVYTPTVGMAVSTACGEANEQVVVNLASPTVTTDASDDIVIGAVGGIYDDATLAGAFEPTGTITFNLYGPDDANCLGTPQIDAVDVDPETTTYRSAGFNPTAAGTYRWTAAYSGDDNNNPFTTLCNDANESVVVDPASPTVTTDASDDIVLGAAGGIYDEATLAGAFEPTGTITFNLYGPDDANCLGTPQIDAVDVDPETTTYRSAAFHPTAAGTYRWTAAYSGDDNNNPFSTKCNDANESVVVHAAPVTPRLATYASRDTFVGKTVFDTALLTGGNNPTGTITFNLYGPGDATCSRTPVFTSVVDVDGNSNGDNKYKSGDFRPRVPGTYQWVAEYSGDENNEGVVTACDDPKEQVVVKKKKPYGGVPRP
ncbi:hypothetical protein [Catellatospora chokoriensis]|nr:hypothetical protein [Catellatospora chokoriensis]